MNKKAEVVLKALIDSYLKLNRPVSSSTLKKEANLPYSASTIRNYLQVLEKEGLIERINPEPNQKKNIKHRKLFTEKTLEEKYNIFFVNNKEIEDSLDDEITIEEKK